MDSSSENVVRPLVDFPQGIDSDFFFESQVDSSQMEENAKEIDELKEQVRGMLVGISSPEDHKDKLELIDVVDRLGVSYHFQPEILNQLDCIFKAYNYENNYDLYTVSVHFRVFRQHGYKITCDVFNKFKDMNGGLQVGLKGDIKGILSLYEAAHLMMHGEEFLEEALDLTTDILSLFASESNLEDECLHKQVIHATKQPLHKGIKIMETRYFIGFYQEDESRNETLLRLAKLDSNMLQLLHRNELKQIIKWWDGLNVKTELPYPRNRSLECHFWALAMGSNPCHSQCRLITAKVVQILTLLDDTYDAYGTIQELDLLTQAFQRWDKDAIDELPVEMKLVFNYVFNLYDEFEKEMVSEKRDYLAHYAKARILDVIKVYHTEAKWAHQGYIPSYKEYMEGAGWMTAGSQIMISSFMMGMDASVANENTFEWIINPVPRIIRADEVIARVMNDITSHKDELASTLKCYMNDHGASEEEAVIALRKVVKDAWKDLNEELVRLKLMNLPPVILDLISNLGRSYHYLYKVTDAFTHSTRHMKIDAVLVYAKPFDV